MAPSYKETIQKFLQYASMLVTHTRDTLCLIIGVFIVFITFRQEILKGFGIE